MRDFTMDIPQDAIEDLHRRIDATRWPDELPGVGWSRGVPVTYLKELVTYWRHEFDWFHFQDEANKWPQFTTDVAGVNVHFIHARSERSDAVPLLITHGWPGSFVEFLDVLAPLTSPANDSDPAFHVVIPTIPGYGFSGGTHETGWDVERVAEAWGQLMSELGYDRYLVQGGDWGAAISLRCAKQRPENVLAVHLNMCPTFPPNDPAALEALSDAEKAKVERLMHFSQDGIGWQKIQATRPQTLAYGLTDSPVGQLAWIIEKFKEWSDCSDAPEEAIARDRLLANATLYWVTATAGSSAQLYYETVHTDADYFATWGGPFPLEQPVGIAVFPADPAQPVLPFAQVTVPSMVHWKEYDRGGHFPAAEEPDLFVADLREFAATHVAVTA